MNKIKGCQYEEKIMRGERDENFERHIAGCRECREAQKVFVWMQKFAGQTQPPQNLPAPGFLLFKSRLVKKQSAAERVVQPIVWMQIAAVLVFFLITGWLMVKSQNPVGSIMKETLNMLASLAPLILGGAASAISICLAFAYFLGKTREIKK